MTHTQMCELVCKHKISLWTNEIMDGRLYVKALAIPAVLTKLECQNPCTQLVVHAPVW